MLVDAAQQALGRSPGRALAAIRRLRVELERVEESQVAAALAAGWSWARIGRALHISRQAVHRKYSACPPVVTPLREDPTLTPGVRVAMLIARTEAAARGDALVGTEHILIGLLQRGEGRASDALRAAGVDLFDLRAKADVLAPAGICAIPPSRIGLTSRAVRAMRRALSDAQVADGPRVCDHHLLRELLEDPNSGASTLLAEVGGSRHEVLEVLGAADELEEAAA